MYVHNFYQSILYVYEAMLFHCILGYQLYSYEYNYELYDNLILKVILKEMAIHLPLIHSPSRLEPV